MKKIKIFNIILALIIMISACDSTYDDIYDQIDDDKAAEDVVNLFNSDKTVSPETYRMTEEDYGILENALMEYAITEEDTSIAESFGDYKSFDEDKTAEDYLPYFCNAKFFSYTPGTEMVVTYDYYIGSDYNDVADLEEWELEDSDYDMFAALDGEHFFTSSTPADQYIPLILEANFPLAEEGSEIFVKYLYNGSHYEVYTEMEFDGAVWTFTGATSGLDIDNAYELEDADYEKMDTIPGPAGPGEKHRFTSDYLPEDYLPDWMLTKYPEANSGDKQVIIYYYRGEMDSFLGFTKSSSGTWSKTHTVEYNYDSGDYNVKTLSVTVEQDALFKFTADGWLFVPPLKFVETTAAHTREYELTDADYELVGNGKYHNFDTGEGYDDYEISARIAKISTILKANFNDLEVGDIFKVTYVGYDGGAVTYTINLEVQLDE